MAKKPYETNIDLPYNLRTIWSFLRNYKPLVWGILLVTIVIEMTSLFDSFVFKYLVDKATLFTNNGLTKAAFWQIIVYAVLIYLGVTLIKSIAWYAKIRFINHLDGNIMRDVEKKSFWHIINLSYRFHANKKTGSIISQFTRGVGKVESFVDAFVFNAIPVFLRLILTIGVIFYFDIATSISVLVMSIVFIIVGVVITNKQKIPQAIANHREDILKQNLSDVFLNVETVKYFAKEKRTFNYFANLSKLLRSSRLYFWNFFSWHAGIQTFVIGCGLASIFYFSFNSFLNGNLTLGSITLIYASVFKLLPLLFGLIHGYREYIRSMVDVDALFRMFKEENEVKDLSQAKPLKVKNAQIEFEKVSFAYPNDGKHAPPAVLKDFNLKIYKNKKVALVGPSGSGKTTIVKLLYRLFDLSEGKITIDGQDIKTISQKSLRENMSIVPQEPLLFDNSIFFNISYANPTATKAQVWKAIKFAQLDKLIAGLPNKENTIVGERGVKLSGGEKQRVSIARALLANRKILVLDEATSALDSGTEREIQKDLDKLMKGRTSIMIAHRLSTIMKADVIVVMEKGKIKEIGNHKELTNKRGGLYRKLWSLQQGGNL
jgi:ATP-binding cassette, subfamily B, heavy metal transporter